MNKVFALLVCLFFCFVFVFVFVFFFFQAEDGIRDIGVTGVQTCALPIYILLGGLAANIAGYFYESAVFKGEPKYNSMSKNVQRCWQPNHLISYLLYDTRSFCWNASLLNCKWHRLGKLCCAGLHCNLLLTKCRLITCSKRKLYIRNVIGCETMALQTSIFIGPYKMT